MSKISPTSEPPISQRMIDKAEAALHEVLSGFNYILPADGIRRILEAAHAASGPDRAPTTTSKMTGLADAIAEHVRQIEVEGWSPEHDDQHDDYSLAKAASVYAACAAVGKVDRAVMDLHGLRGTPGKLQELWPLSWDISWLKPRNRRRDLIKAAALIIAEIERLDRAAAKNLEGSDNG